MLNYLKIEIPRNENFSFIYRKKVIYTENNLLVEENMRYISKDTSFLGVWEYSRYRFPIVSVHRYLDAVAIHVLLQNRTQITSRSSSLMRILIVHRVSYFIVFNVLRQ